MSQGRWDLLGAIFACTLWFGIFTIGALSEAQAAGAADPATPAGAEANSNGDAADPEDDAAAGDKEALHLTNVFAAPDRSVLRLLDKAQLLSDQNRQAEAVRCLGEILNSSEDYFFQPDKARPVHVSLRSEAQRLLGEMPTSARELYELQYGARARRMLDDATSTGDSLKLADVSRRFFHTQAGYDATLLLGLHHLNRSCPLGAALTLERLRDTAPGADRFEPMLSTALATCWIRSDRPDKAAVTLAALRERIAGATVSLGGQEVSLFSDHSESIKLPLTKSEAAILLTKNDNPLGRLASLVGLPSSTEPGATEQWAMYRGEVTRNASANGGGPLLNLRWRVPTSNHPFVEALLAELAQLDRDQGGVGLPGLHPLAIGDTILMRTARTLQAVDLTSGKRLWEVPVDDPFESLAQQAPGTPFNPGVYLGQALRMRMWGDYTYGTLSSDGRLVFSIEDLNFGVGPVNATFINVPGMSRNANTSAFNRLAAYDIQTGKLKWHVGGDAAGELGLMQSGTFFLGPPLPLMEQLFVLAEAKGEIRVVALDAKTGRELWSQQLVDVNREILDDPMRRMAGVSPSYADGILVCPTSNNAIVALELATRALLWGYTYSSDENRPGHPVVFFGGRPSIGASADGGWKDNSIVLSAGRVLVTPSDSKDLHCLNLIDGKPLWTTPRDGDIYLACVHKNDVVLVGRNSVRALSLDDGSEAWEGRKATFPDGGSPTGVGFLSDNRYFVPLSTAEVLTVDLDNGTVGTAFKSRRGIVPGNLICHRDRIISQRTHAVEAFYQLDALRELVGRRLGEEENDAEALALHGEILWHENKLEEAVAVFRRSLELAPNPNTRELCLDSFLDGLKLDFATHRKHVDEVEALIDTPEKRATFLRLMAVGYEDAGEFPQAIEGYLELVDLDSRHRGMERVDDVLSVRRDRWLQVQLAELRDKIPSQFQAELDRLVEARLTAAIAAEGPADLARFLEYFGPHPAAADAPAELAVKLRDSEQLLAAELTLLGQQRTGIPERAGSATVELAALLRSAERWPEAAACYSRLHEEFSGVVCLDGKTGNDLFEELADNDPVRRQLDNGSAWPTGLVEVKLSTEKTVARPTYAQYPISYTYDPAPFLSDFTLELLHSPPALIGRDGWGNQQWQLSLAELAVQGRMPFNPSLAQASVRGHLLLVSLGNTVLAVDTLDLSDDGSPKLLWTRDLDQSTSDSTAVGQIRVMMANVGGIQQIRMINRSRMPAATPGLLSERVLVGTRSRTISGIDPATGDTLWLRQNIQPQSTVFGDAEHVFVVGPEAAEAIVLGAFDGKVLGTRSFPSDPEMLGIFGPGVLLWRTAGDHHVLELIDVWTGRKVWPSLKFSVGSRYHLLEDDGTIAVLDPSGRFVIMGIESGRAIVETQVDPEVPLEGIITIRSPDQYILIVQGSPKRPDPKRQVQTLRGTRSVKVSQAKVYAFDLDGRQLWDSPTEIDEQCLLLNQPSRLPVLTFACTVREQQENNRNTSKYSLLSIDKRTGRKVYDFSFSGASNSFLLAGNPDQKTVEMRLQERLIKMTFTDKPIPPEPETEVTPMQAILNAIREAALGPTGNSLKRSPPKPPTEAVPNSTPVQPAGDPTAPKPSGDAVPAKRDPPKVN